VNCDGKIRSNDAILILRVAAGLLEMSALKCDVNVNNATPSIQPIESIRREITVMLEETHGVAGESITVPLKVDNIQQLAGGDICITYDNTVLRAVDVSSDSDVFVQSNIAEPGMIRIAFASADTLHSKTIAGVVVEIAKKTTIFLSDSLSPLRE